MADPVSGSLGSTDLAEGASSGIDWGGIFGSFGSAGINAAGSIFGSYLSARASKDAGKQALKNAFFMQERSFEQLTQLRNRDILAIRRNPFFQASAVSALSRFTNLNVEQANALVQKMAASTNPLLETRFSLEGGPAGEGRTDYLARLDAENNDSGSPYLSAGGLLGQGAGGEPITVQGTDIFSNEQIRQITQDIREQGAEGLSQLLRQSSGASAARGVSGAISVSELGQQGLASIFSQSQANETAAKAQAAQVNRQSYFDVLGLLDALAGDSAGSFS